MRDNEREYEESTGFVRGVLCAVAISVPIYLLIIWLVLR